MMFMAFHAKRSHRPWLVAGAGLLAVAGLATALLV